MMPTVPGDHSLENTVLCNMAQINLIYLNTVLQLKCSKFVFFTTCATNFPDESVDCYKI
jgi:hypothetical protein